MKIPDFFHYKIYEWESAELAANQFKSKRSQDKAEPLQLAKPLLESHPQLPPMRAEHPALTHPVVNDVEPGFIPQFKTLDPEFLRLLRKFVTGQGLKDYVAKLIAEERFAEEMAAKKFVDHEREEQKVRIDHTHAERFEQERVNHNKRIESLDQDRIDMNKHARHQLEDSDTAKARFWSMRNLAKQLGEFLIASRLGQTVVSPTNAAATAIRGQKPPGPPAPMSTKAKLAANAEAILVERKLHQKIEDAPEVRAGNKQLAQIVGFIAYRTEEQKSVTREPANNVVKDTIGEGRSEAAVKPLDSAGGATLKKVS